MTADEAMIGSLGLTLSEGGVIAGEATIGSYRHAPFGASLLVDEETVGSSREDQHLMQRQPAPADLEG
jgi:hypothetical protein